MKAEKITIQTLPPNHLPKRIIHAIFSPLVLIALACGIYFGGNYYFADFLQNYNSSLLSYAYIALQGILLLSTVWVIIRLIDAVGHYLLSLKLMQSHQTAALIFPYLISASKAVTLLATLNIVVDHLGLPAQFELLFGKISSLAIIMCIGWVLFQLTYMSEQLVIKYYQSKKAGDLAARKIYTQMRILKNIIISLLLIVTLGAALMLFDNVRSLGASVLTTAGIAGIILTLAAQRSLPSLMAGIEIALSQPIKIGDAVIVENEFGVIERINLRYVVVKLWDWRRLVVPTNYFLEKPFQNWSREQTTNLIGTTYLYVDYTMPVDVLRNELLKILGACDLWDKKVSSIQVSDAKERTMELRILTSAKTPANAWDLRCQVREKLIAFIAKNYPQCLPHERTRQYLFRDSSVNDQIKEAGASSR